MMHGMNLKTTVKTKWLLDKLRDNRSQHGTCYQEALKGYLAEAQKSLDKALRRLRDGEAIALQFHLHVPEDHTKDYDTVIGMLDAHTEDTLKLNSSEYRMFVEDEWDWSNHWLLSNAAYSGTTAELARGKGLM